MPSLDENTGAQAAPLPGRRAMVVRAFLAYNIVVGCAFGGLSVALLPIRERYDVDSATAALCMSAIMLSGGLASPFTAAMIARFGIRSTMMTGAVLTVLGYLALAFAPTINMVLAAYALLVGLGVATCGAFPAIVLANAWFQPNPGRAVGFVNMAVGVALVPFAMESVVAEFGLRTFYLIFAMLCALLIPIVWGVADIPAVSRTAEEAATARDDRMPSSALLRSGRYWTLIVCGGILVAMSMAGLAHIFAFAMERGQSAKEAALLASMLGGTSIVGALSAGVLCDRIGGAFTLMLTGIGFAVGWAALFLTTATVPMLIAISLIGVCGGGVYPAFSVLAGKLYGRATLPRALGLYGLLILPMLILLPPLAGVIRDSTGSYQLVALVFAAIGCVTAIAFYVMSRVIVRQRGYRTFGAKSAADEVSEISG